jgi:CO/xanthine dehydrogenase Mo-binding subunit
MITQDASRRNFIKLLGIGGGGLVLGLPLSGCGRDSKPDPLAGDDDFSPSVWLQITPDNTINFYQPYTEMGQGSMTGITTLLAEELGVAPEAISVHHAGVDKAFKNPEFKAQGTGASTSIKASYLPVRQLGADARETIRAAAASQLGAPVNELEMGDGQVVWQGKAYPYGDFAATAATITPASKTPLKQPDEFTVIGKKRPRLDGLAKSTGTAEFGIDVDIPNLHYAVLLRCPVHGGLVKRFDPDAAEAMPGVTKVVEIFNGVAVVGESYWQARQAADRLQVEWDLPEDLAKFSSDKARAQFKMAIETGKIDKGHKEGEGARGLDGAASKISAEYWVPYIAHATMETMSCTVRFEDGYCDVWVGNQFIAVAQGIAAHYGGIDKERVTVHSCFLGGGFGRRMGMDYVAEATAIAKEADLPVQLLWSREDDIRHDIYRPASLVQYEAGLDSNGEWQTWTVTRAGPNILPGAMKVALGVMLPEFLPHGMSTWLGKKGYSLFDGVVIDPYSVEGLIEDYDVANTEISHVTVDPGMRVGFLRSVGHSYSGFFKESFMDEIAHSRNVDPLQWRLDYTRNNPRLNKTLQMVAEAAGWGSTLPEGHFQGIASHTSFSTAVSQIAEVSVQNGQLKIHKVTCAIDCGLAINPEMIRAQMESGIIFGISAALYGEISVVDGRVVQSNFHDYQVVRMHEAPEIEVVIVDTDDAPTGVGEPGVPPIAAAIGNAIFSATGQRLRSLPFKLA